MKFKSHKLKKVFIATVWLLIYSLVSQGQLFDLVLCLGTDGHIEVEASQNGSCCLSSNTTSQEISHISSLLCAVSNKEYCGPCIDIPILISSSNQNIVLAQGPTPQIKALQLAFFSFSLPEFEEIATEGRLIQPLSSNNSTLVSLRTVILLI